MALTIDNKQRWVAGTKRFCICTISFDSSYPTGGEDFTLADFGFKRRIDYGHGFGSGYVCEADRTNLKILAYYGDNNNASDGPLIEVPNTTNLSTLTSVRFLAIGV